MKKRILIIGSTGIISTNLQIKLDKENLKYSVIGRREINLKSSKSFKYLSKRVNKDDIVVFIAAEAPAKNTEMFINNIKIIIPVNKPYNDTISLLNIFPQKSFYYSHSIVAGGFDDISKQTRDIPGTSLIILVETSSKKSNGKSKGFAVIKSIVFTALRERTFP